MLSKNSLELQQSNGGPALSGYWKLTPGHAVSLQPRAAGVLRISQGRVWITFDGPHAGHGNESGDYFLQAGQQTDVRAGQRLVLESWSEVPVYFEWVPDLSVLAVQAARWKTAWSRLLTQTSVGRDRPVCSKAASTSGATG